MPTEMMRNYAAEASALLTRWKRGEDVQDALAHQLRRVSAGLNTLQAEVVTLREDKARLDWIERKGARVSQLADTNFNVWVFTKGDYEGGTIRDAIDAARKA